MRVLMTVLLLGLMVSAASADILFEEYFTDGSLQDGWFSPWSEQDAITVEPDGDSPGGDGWVGSVGPDHTSTALNGTIDMTDYTVTAWVYNLVTTDTMFPPYNAIAARWDTTGGENVNSYYYFTSQFGVSKKLRLRRFPGSGLGAETFLEWTGDQIPGGEPTESGWHKMSMKVAGDEIWCWWDDVLLDGCPYTPQPDFRQTAGFFGAYMFYVGDQVAEPATRIDDYVVNDDNNAVGDITLAPLPQSNALTAIYPNPFNAATTIHFTNQQPGEVSLSVIDLLGREMTTLQHGFMTPGQHQVSWQAGDMATGSYFIVLQADGRQHMKRVVLTK